MSNGTSRQCMGKLVSAIEQLLVVRQTLLTEPAQHRTAAQLAALESQLTALLAQLEALVPPSRLPLRREDEAA